jgi:hypothetical protein
MSDAMEGALQGTLEENVVAALAWHDELAPMISMRVDATLFSTRAFRSVAEKAMDHLRIYGRPPRAHLTDLLERELARGDHGRLLRQTLERIEVLGPELQPDFVIDQLDRFITIRQMMMQVEEAADKLHNEDVTGATEALNRVTNKVDFSEGVFLHDVTRSLRFLDRAEEDYFSSGIEVLDHLNVVPARKTVTMLLGTAKSGKSWYLIATGKAALRHRHSVLHITLENSEELTCQRYIQAIFGMTENKGEDLRRLYFQKDERGGFVRFAYDERLVEAEGVQEIDRRVLSRRVRALRRRPPLLIKEFPSGELTLSQLSMYLKMLKRTHNFVPDMLIVDYPDLMRISVENRRVDIGAAVVGIRGLCTEYNMAGVIVSQGHRASFTASTVHGGMVAEDYSKLGTVDTVLAYSQTRAERERGLARLSVEAARSSIDKFMVLITQQYRTGQFCLDSIRMNKVAEQAAQKIMGSAAEDEQEDTDA